jgi:hypothetical protein
VAGQGNSLHLTRRDFLYHYRVYQRPPAGFYSLTYKTLIMKKNRDDKWMQGMQELPMEDAKLIIGGESIWYYPGWAIGVVGYLLFHPSSYQSAGQQAMNMALG